LEDREKSIDQRVEEGLVFEDRAAVAKEGLISDRNSVDDPSI
jgi:hypothetical protein